MKLETSGEDIVLIRNGIAVREIQQTMEQSRERETHEKVGRQQLKEIGGALEERTLRPSNLSGLLDEFYFEQLVLSFHFEVRENSRLKTATTKILKGRR